METNEEEAKKHDMTLMLHVIIMSEKKKNERKKKTKKLRLVICVLTSDDENLYPKMTTFNVRKRCITEFIGIPHDFLFCFRVFVLKPLTMSTNRN